MANDLRTLLSERLKKLVPLPANGFDRGPRNAEVIAIAAQKGGVGKTTTAVALAAGLSVYHDKRVLLLDLDSQGHVATSFRNTVPANLPRLSEILLAPKRRELLEAVFTSSVDKLDLVASDKSLNETESLLATKIGKEFILRGALDITRTHYDFIIIDCPPNLGNLTLNALSAADHLIIPSDLTVLSLEGVGDLLAAVQTLNDRLHHKLNVLGILPTRVDRRNKSLNTTMEQSLNDLFGGFVFDCEIPMNTAVSRAQLEGQTLYEYDAAAKASVAYREFILEVMNKLGQRVDQRARA